MALRRRGRDEPVSRRFEMREKLMSIGDDYWIEDDSGQRAFKVNGKAARLRDTWVLEDMDGREVASIRERKLSVRDSIKIDVGGREAKVKKALMGLRDRFHVEVEHGEDLTVKGNFVDHEYEIEREASRSPRSRRSGCGPATPMESRCATRLTSCSCLPSRSPSTRSRTTDRATVPTHGRVRR